MSRTKQVAAFIGAAAVLAASAMALAPGSAQAASSPCINSGNFQDGYYTPVSAAIFGVRANIQYGTPALCGSTSASTAWVMLQPQSPTNTYAQIGYLNNGGPNGFDGYSAGEHYVVEYVDDAGTPHVYFGGDVGAQSHRYQVYWSPSDHKIHMVVDSTSLGTTWFQPDVNHYWSPNWQGYFAGETFDQESDVPGVPGGHVRFDQLAQYDVNDNQSYISTPWGYSGQQAPRYQSILGPYSANGYYIDIFTSPL